jgi:hypothetical protein
MLTYRSHPIESDQLINRSGEFMNGNSAGLVISGRGQPGLTNTIGLRSTLQHPKTLLQTSEQYENLLDVDAASEHPPYPTRLSRRRAAKAVTIYFSGLEVF